MVSVAHLFEQQVDNFKYSVQNMMPDDQFDPKTQRTDRK
jgi:hypothetical protein